MVMKKMRKYAKKLLIIIAIFIIPAFVLWGAGSALRGKGNQQYAGKIFDKKISFKEYSQSWQECRNQALMLYGKNLDKVTPMLNLKKQAWERLILLEKAKQEDITVKDEEIINTIKKLPFFHKGSTENSKFDKETYKTILKYVFRTTPNKFEKQIKNSLIIQNLIQKKLDNVTTTDEEIKQAYREENEKVKVSYILFDKEEFKNKVKITPEKLKNYYIQHKSEFKQPPKAKIKYLYIDYAAIKEKINIKPEEISNYFKSHKKQFSSNNNIQEKEAPVSNKNDIAQETKPEAKDIVLNEKIKKQIKNILLTEKTIEIAKTKANQISNFLIENPNLNKASEKFSIPLKQTDYFAIQEPILGIGWSYKIAQKAFSMEKDEISDIINLPKKGLFFIQLIDKKPSVISAFEQVKSKVELKYKNYKAMQLAKDKSKEKLEKLQNYINNNMSWKKILSKLNLEIQTTKFFKREDYIKNIGRSKKFVSISFSGEIGKLYPEIIPIAKGYCLVRPVERKNIDEKKWAEEKEKFKQKYLARKKQQHYSKWLQQIIQNANLENNLDNLKKQAKRNK